MSRTLVVLNPVSAGGRTVRRWQQCAPVLSAAHLDFDVYNTRAPGDAIDAVRRALRDGYRSIVAVGGDGTLNEVVNGFFDEHGTPLGADAVLGVIPSGTGGDFRRSVGIPGVSTSAAHVVAQGDTRRIDIARIDFDGGERRFFINIADCGIGGEVVRRVNRSRFKGGGAPGSAVFLWQSLRTLLTYGGRRARIDVDGDVISGLVRSIVVANGRYFGGGMHVAPQAALDDGLLDVVVVAATSRTQAVAGIPSLYRGRHLGRREVQFRRGVRVRIESVDEPLLFDVEGEQVGQTPATITCLPSAITVHAPLRRDQYR
jgi:diacylglycerol kinase (ATP)